MTSRLEQIVIESLDSLNPALALGARVTMEHLEDLRSSRAPAYQNRSALPVIDLADLIERGIPRVPASQELSRRGNQIRTGHEPVHGSSSGNCLAIWPDEGRWFCYGCNRGGDSLAYIVGLINSGGSPGKEDWKAAAKILREISRGGSGTKDQMMLEEIGETREEME